MRRAASTPAGESSPNTSRCARPRPWSAMGVPTPSRPRVRKDAAHAHDARPPHLLDLEQRLNQHLGTTGLDPSQEYGSRPDHHRLSFARGVRPTGVPVSSSRCAGGRFMMGVDRMVASTSAFASRFAPNVRRKRMLVHCLLIQSAANFILDLFLLLCSQIVCVVRPLRWPADRHFVCL